MDRELSKTCLRMFLRPLVTILCQFEVFSKHSKNRWGGHKKKIEEALFSRAPPFQLSLPGLIPAGGAEIFLAPNPALQK